MKKDELLKEVIKLVETNIAAMELDSRDPILQEALFDECLATLKEKITSGTVYRVKKRLRREEDAVLRRRHKEARQKSNDENPESNNPPS